MQVLNKVEKELIEYYQEVQQSKEEVTKKSNDEFNITNYDYEFSENEIALTEKKLGFKILSNPKNAVNISITNELEKFKWEEMTFEEKLKLAEEKQMSGSINFNTKTKNIILFAEEYYGNKGILREKIEKPKNIQIKDDQVPSTSREFANKNSPLTQSSSVSRSIEIKNINSKEKELEAQLVALQELKAKKMNH